MSDIKHLNILFKKEDLIPLYELKMKNRWRWDELVLETAEFYIKYHQDDYPQDNFSYEFG